MCFIYAEFHLLCVIIASARLISGHNTSGIVFLMHLKRHLISQWYVERSWGWKTSSISVVEKKKRDAAAAAAEDEGTFYWLIKNTVFSLYVVPGLLPLAFNKDTVKVYVPLSW